MKTTILKLTENDILVLDHSLDICESDYSHDPINNKKILRDIRRVRNKIWKQHNAQLAKEMENE